MPNRNKSGKERRGKEGGNPHGGGAVHESDEEDSDGQSIVSHLSLDDDVQSMAGQVDEEDINEDEGVIEGKIDDLLEKAIHKTTSVRLSALRNLRMYLSGKVLPDAVDKYKQTIVDVAIKALKRGASTEECCTGLSLLTLVTIQCLDAGENVISHVTLLRTILTDESLSSEVRCHSALTISLCSVFALDDIEEFRQSCDSCKSVWSGVKSGSTTAEAVPLFCASLAAWALLLSKMPYSKQIAMINSELPKLCAYLKSCQVEARTCAGEILSVLYEYGYESNDDFRPANHQQTIDILGVLANDSLKYRAKRDRRKQRATFREIYSAVHEGEGPSVKLKLSNLEEVHVTSWVDKLYYDSLCTLLRGGINTHMQTNPILRNIFELGPPINPASLATQTASKSMKMAMFNSIEKERQLARGKQRSKRQQQIQSED